MQEEIRCIVRGRVQMVMYRDFAQRKARVLSVVGSARNLEDGTVEIVAQGLPEQLRLFIEALNEGSVLARVDEIAVEWRSSSDRYDDFSILY